MSDRKTSKPRQQIGKDEMNFAEFPLALVGKRAPASVKTLHFSDETIDRKTGRTVRRKLTISAADVLGLPTAVDDEVMLGCLQLSFQSGFASPKVTFRRSEFLEVLGWKRSGHHYRRLADSLRKWKGTLLISENGFWDKGEDRWVNDSFSLLDRVYLSGRGPEAAGRDEECYFEWGDFVWRSIEAGNLRSLDFEFIKSLHSGVSKRLYRWLGKRFYHGGTVTIDLKRLAFEKVGFSRGMHTGQIKEKLAASHAELESRGVCRAEYVQRGRGQWDVVYRQSPRDASPARAHPDEQRLVDALKQRKIKQRARQLVAQHPRERIEIAIENYDDRRAHGEAIGPGWLVNAITAAEPYEFRRGYTPQAQRVAARQREARQSRHRQDRDRQLDAASASERTKFEEFLGGLDDSARNAYAEQALSGSSLRARTYRDQLSRTTPEQRETTRRDAMYSYWLGAQRSITGRR